MTNDIEILQALQRCAKQILPAVKLSQDDHMLLLFIADLDHLKTYGRRLVSGQYSVTPIGVKYQRQSKSLRLVTTTNGTKMRTSEAASVAYALRRLEEVGIETIRRNVNTRLRQLRQSADSTLSKKLLKPTPQPPSEP
jgi:hypothetical protein